MGGNKGALCAASTCQNYRKTCPGMSFFRFPSEKNRCLKWIINSGRKDLEPIFFTVSHHYFSTNYVLCAAHFTNCCFMNPDHNKLVHDAVPSLFVLTADLFRSRFKLNLAMPSMKEDRADSYGEPIEALIKESRSLDLFIGKKLQDMKKSKLDSINICIPHEHGTNKKEDLSVTKSGFSEAIVPPLLEPAVKKSSSAKQSHYFLCCSRGCLSTSISATLFSFPGLASEARVWLERCGRSDLTPLLESHGSVPNNFLLCEDHFNQNQFSSTKRSAKTLTQHAMPTVFPSNTDDDPTWGAIDCRSRKRTSSAGVKASKTNTSKLQGLKLVSQDKLINVSGCPGGAKRRKSAIGEEFCRQQGISTVAGRGGDVDGGQGRKGLRRLGHKPTVPPEPISRLCLRSNSLKEKDGCAYKFCLGHKKKRNLYRFPKDPSRCKAWMLNCGYNSLPHAMMASEDEPYNSGYKLCADHFQDTCFFTLNGTSFKLLNYAIPTLFTNTRIQYPCQHKSLPEKYRNCAHVECQALIKSGVYDRHVEARPPTDHNNTFLKCLSAEQRARQYVVCDSANMSAGSSDEERDAGEADRTSPSNVPQDDVTEGGTSPPPMIFEDSTMTVQDKLDALDADIRRLQGESAILARSFSCYRNHKYRLKCTIQNLALVEPEKFTEDDAFRYCRHKLSDSTYQFFVCQKLHRKFPPWNLSSLQIPTIANRCGLGVRETLFEIFRMPTTRTISRYRLMLKKDPSSVPDDHLLKNDIEKKFHRRLYRKHRTPKVGTKSISSVINDYITKANLDCEDIGDSSATNTSYPIVPNVINGQLVNKNYNNDLYYHKKYNNPQKWKLGDLDE